LRGTAALPAAQVLRMDPPQKVEEDGGLFLFQGPAKRDRFRVMADTDAAPG
jgi:hypothetical protein